jgi:hypothetical protein
MDNTYQLIRFKEYSTKRDQLDSSEPSISKKPGFEGIYLNSTFGSDRNLRRISTFFCRNIEELVREFIEGDEMSIKPGDIITTISTPELKVSYNDVRIIFPASVEDITEFMRLYVEQTELSKVVSSA